MSNRTEDIALCYYRNNQDDIVTAKILGIKPSTVRREIRKFKQLNKQSTPAKIFITDIETAQMLVKVWGLYKQRIDYRRIVKDWFIMMWAGKWLFSNEVMGDCVTSREAKDRDDSRILKSIWRLLDEAEIIVGHNIFRFDIRKLNARFLKHSIMPPSSYQIVDTLKQSRRNFDLSSHKLDYITGYLELPGKLETHIDLWDRCEEGNQEALDDMFAYCKNDVVITEEVYIEILPWMKSHPTIGLYGNMEEDSCPNCGSMDLKKLKGLYVTPLNKYPTYRCKDCGKPSHSRKSVVSQEQRKHLLRSSAK